MTFNPTLSQYINALNNSDENIEEYRKELLLSVAGYIRSTPNPKLNFICTHNSRRSHLGQVWAQTMSAYFNIPLETYSGGIETTTFHPNAIASLERAGFEIASGKGSNPRVELRFSSNTDPIVCYSKEYDDDSNPKRDFAAIMTCSEADQECPIVFGATERIKLLYEDPKIADGTDQEREKYDERCHQIAIEMFYVFSNINF